MAYTEPEPDDNAPLGIGGWLAIAVLLAILAGAIFYAVHDWNILAGTGISTLGWVFLSLGVIVTTGVAIGLMGLLFYSNRNKLDR
ncbi:MAG TPA: hypothetical protein VGG10_02085 [Rhizomicrobium sp.]|jgi:hypothetical protein